MSIKDYMKLNGFQRYQLQVELGVDKLPQGEAHLAVIKHIDSVVKR